MIFRKSKLTYRCSHEIRLYIKTYEAIFDVVTYRCSHIDVVKDRCVKIALMGDKDGVDENAGNEYDGGNMNDDGGKKMDKNDGENKDDGGNINEEGASGNEGRRLWDKDSGNMNY
ncbi:hypothetical protein Tco_0912197 [Tanacetum coccineum]